MTVKKPKAEPKPPKPTAPDPSRVGTPEWEAEVRARDPIPLPAVLHIGSACPSCGNPRVDKCAACGN